MKKPILLIDLDETLADFSGALPEKQQGEWTPESMFEEGFFYNLKPIDGAIGAVKKLVDSNMFDIWICSVPVAGLHESYSDKSRWVSKYFPALYNKIILCQDKKMVIADYAIDDRPELYNESVKVFNPVTRKANRRYKWHKIVEDLKNAEYAKIPEFTPEEDDDLIDICIAERAEKDLGDDTEMYDEYYTEDEVAQGMLTPEEQDKRYPYCVYEEYGYDRPVGDEFAEAYDKIVEKHDKALKRFADDDKL